MSMDSKSSAYWLLKKPRIKLWGPLMNIREGYEHGCLGQISWCRGADSPAGHFGDLWGPQEKS